MEWGIKSELGVLMEDARKDVMEGFTVKAFKDVTLNHKLNFRVTMQVCDGEKLLSQSSRKSESTIGELLDAF